jgi:uridine kinase
LIAVVGGSGAGKGWLVERVCRLVGSDACHLQLDDFYRDRSHLPLQRRARINFDAPRAIDWTWAERVLRACRSGHATSIPRYDFATHSRSEQPADWEPRALVLVDGLWLLRPPAIRALFDLKLYLDTPSDLRSRRRLARDVAERGYPRDAVEYQLRTAVAPMHERYVEPQKKWADVILTQPFEEPQLLALANRLWSMLDRASLTARWDRETFCAEFLRLIAHHEYCN